MARTELSVPVPWPAQRGGTQRMKTAASAVATGTVYTVFFGTGIALVLPGALLPLLLTRWSLDDTQAGGLLFLFFLGTIAGSLLSRGWLPGSIARGCAAAALGLCSLALTRGHAIFAAMPLYGFGLGNAMTSISLLQSRRHTEQRASEMARLNLVWSMGACLGPWIGLHGAAVAGVPVVLNALAACFVVLALLTLLLVPHAEAELPNATDKAWGMSFLLLLLVPLATGTESAAGGWLATYSRRAGDTFGEVIGTATCFWAGMLLSRFAQSLRNIAAALSRPLLILGPCIMAIGLALVLTTHSSAAMLSGALLLGLGIGPMYPLLLALTLGRGEGKNVVFVAAGCGASLLPFLTGLVSGRLGSLRAGLCVPLAASLLMLALGVAVRKDRVAS